MIRQTSDACEDRQIDAYEHTLSITQCLNISHLLHRILFHFDIKTKLFSRCLLLSSADNLSQIGPELQD